MDDRPERPSAATYLAAVAAAHRRLVGLLKGLSEEDRARQSYAEDWSVAQVASHLGSQAEVFALVLHAALTGGTPPGLPEMQEVWGRWDAKEYGDMVRDCVDANEAFLDRVEGLDERQRAEVSVDLFGSTLDLAAVLAMRLGELTLHTWDVEVALDPSAELPDDAAALLVDRLARIATSGVAAPHGTHDRYVVVDVPARVLRLQLSHEVALEHVDVVPEGVADHDVLRLPAAALVRAVYGRLDPEHTPSDIAGDGRLDLLRSTFRGV